MRPTPQSRSLRPPTDSPAPRADSAPHGGRREGSCSFSTLSSRRLSSLSSSSRCSATGTNLSYHFSLSSCPPLCLLCPPVNVSVRATALYCSSKIHLFFTLEMRGTLLFVLVCSGSSLGLLISLTFVFYVCFTLVGNTVLKVLNGMRFVYSQFNVYLSLACKIHIKYSLIHLQSFVGTFNFFVVIERLCCN